MQIGLMNWGCSQLDAGKAEHPDFSVVYSGSDASVKGGTPVT